MIAPLVLVLLAAYLIGAIPTGLIVSRLKGVDIRKQGSGNYGATNVGRALGKPWGILVFLLDAAKGALTIIIAGQAHARGMLGGAWSETRLDFLWLGAGLCCILGNTLPVYLKFRGGKGVATSLGVVLAIWPYMTIPAIASFVVWAVVVKASGYISLGSIVAAIALPAAFLVTARIAAWNVREHYPLLLLCVALAAMVLVRHRSNIGRLLAGTENRIGQPAGDGGRS